MLSSPSVLSAQRRALHYWFDDGFSTLVAGLGCLFMSFFLFYHRGDRHSPFSIVVNLLVLFAYGTLMFRLRDVIEWLKARITYPRTGFALPPDLPDEAATYADLTVVALQDGESKRLVEAGRIYADRKRRMLFMATFVLLPMLSLMLVRQPWIWAVAGVMTSAGLWIGTRKEQPLSWLLLAGFPLVGIGMAVFVGDHVVGTDRGAYFLTSMGGLFFIDGALTLFRYLRNNPMPKPTPS